MQVQESEKTGRVGRMEGMHNFGDEQLRMHSLCIGAQLSKRSALMHSPSSHSVLTGKVRPRSGGKSGVMERMMDMTPRKLDGLRENIRQGRSRDNTCAILRCMESVIKSLLSSVEYRLTLFAARGVSRRSEKSHLSRHSLNSFQSKVTPSGVLERTAHGGG